MSELIRVPDIGNGEGEVIELLVKVGDAIEADQSLLTLESDKASMEIPAPRAGVVSRLLVKLGDRLKEGDPLLELQAADTQPATAASTTQTAAPAAHDDLTPAAQPVAPSEGNEILQDIHVPDIGAAGKARVIELLVKVGEQIDAVTVSGAEVSAQVRAGELTMLAWYGHAEPDIVAEFEAENNVKFVPKYYTGGDNMLGLISQSPPGTFDVILSDAEYVLALNEAGYVLIATEI